MKLTRRRRISRTWLPDMDWMRFVWILVAVEILTCFYFVYGFPLAPQSLDAIVLFELWRDPQPS